jgi:hypothetical protein
VLGTIDFVYRRHVGGILAGCFGDAPCPVITYLFVGRTLIASSGPQTLGANEIGYVLFSLTPAGRTLLANAPGNQLSARLVLKDGTATARAQLALVSFG